MCHFSVEIKAKRNLTLSIVLWSNRCKQKYIILYHNWQFWLKSETFGVCNAYAYYAVKATRFLVKLIFFAISGKKNRYNIFVLHPIPFRAKHVFINCMKKIFLKFRWRGHFYNFNGIDFYRELPNSWQQKQMK